MPAEEPRDDASICGRSRPPPGYGSTTVVLQLRGPRGRALQALRGPTTSTRAGPAPSCDLRPGRTVSAATRPDGLFTPLGRALDEFFDAAGPRRATGDTEARAAGRRVRVIGTVPDPLRPMVATFSVAELANRHAPAAAADGSSPTRHWLIHLQVAADFARHTPDIDDWTTVAQGDVEAFLVLRSPASSYILPSLRAFFSWARQQRLILVNPTRNVRNQLRRRFSGPVVDLATQRQLFRRWTTDLDVAPNEALIGLLTLLHGATVDDLRQLAVADIDHVGHTIALTGRSRPVPLDPSTWAALQATLAHRHSLNTANPHVLVNRRTKVTSEPIAVPTPPTYSGRPGSTRNACAAPD